MPPPPPSLLRLTLREIARLERRGFRPPRLTEVGHERWHRVRRKLGWVAFIDLLHEDLADAFPTCFAFDRWAIHPTRNGGPEGTELGDEDAKKLIDDASRPDDSDHLAFLRLACRELGLLDGGNLAALPKVQAHQRALELPGCGGRIAVHQALTHGVSFHEAFVFVADTDAERIAVGLAVAELQTNTPKIVSTAELLAEHSRFDQVLGIKGYPQAERLAAELGQEVRWA